MSAICFNLDESKILLSGNRLINACESIVTKLEIGHNNQFLPMSY